MRSEPDCERARGTDVFAFPQITHDGVFDSDSDGAPVRLEVLLYV
jgi:hypothetical protein